MTEDSLVDASAAAVSQTAHSPPPLRLVTMVHHNHEVGNKCTKYYKLNSLLKKNPIKQKLYSYFTESSFKGAKTSN